MCIKGACTVAVGMQFRLQVLCKRLYNAYMITSIRLYNVYINACFRPYNACKIDTRLPWV